MSTVETSFNPFLEKIAHEAIGLAEYSALNNGKDIPVGAVALFGASIVGTGYAHDGESGIDHMHAEVAAIEDASGDSGTMPNIIVTTMEPCRQCQDRMAEIESITTVAYVTKRLELSKRSLVLPRPSIEERVARFELPYNVVYLGDRALQSLAVEPLDFTTRVLPDGPTTVDSAGFAAHIAARAA